MSVNAIFRIRMLAPHSVAVQFRLFDTMRAQQERMTSSYKSLDHEFHETKKNVHQSYPSHAKSRMKLETKQ